MTDLAEFLLARIDEDEAVAQAAASYSAEWCTGDEFNETVLLAVNDNQGHTFDSVYGQIAPHISRHDPARVLAECEAKRRIVDLHAGQDSIVEWFDAPDTGHSDVCPSCHPAEPTHWNPPIGKAGVRPQGFVASYVLAPCLTLRLLALPYADHPEYREEWRL